MLKLYLMKFKIIKDNLQEENHFYQNTAKIKILIKSKPILMINTTFKLLIIKLTMKQEMTLYYHPSIHLNRNLFKLTTLLEN